MAVTQDELYATLDLELSWSEQALPEHVRTKHVHRLHPYHGKFIPQLVEAFPGLVKSVSLSKPTLEDAFIAAYLVGVRDFNNSNLRVPPGVLYWTDTTDPPI